MPMLDGHDVVGSDKVDSTFVAPPSHQPALCWLPGPLPVTAGDIYPLVASHNTVRSDGIMVDPLIRHTLLKGRMHSGSPGTLGWPMLKALRGPYRVL